MTGQQMSSRGKDPQGAPVMSPSTLDVVTLLFFFFFTTLNLTGNLSVYSVHGGKKTKTPAGDMNSDRDDNQVGQMPRRRRGGFSEPCIDAAWIF